MLTLYLTMADLALAAAALAVVLYEEKGRLSSPFHHAEGGDNKKGTACICRKWNGPEKEFRKHVNDAHHSKSVDSWRLEE